MGIRGTWRMRATGVALATLLASAGAGPASADPLTVEKDGAVKVEKDLEVGGKIQAGTVKAEKGLEVGPNGAQANEKGATVQGFNGRNYFQDSEKAGPLRVGALNGTPGIYSEKGDVAVGSQSGKIQLKGIVEANTVKAEKALEVGALRVGALDGTPGIYSEKGSVVVGSQSGTIQLKGGVEAASFSGKGALPVNAILMWSGSLPAMPDGWALCDGGNSTPNLSDRFMGTTRAEYTLAYIMYKGSSDGNFRLPSGSYRASCKSVQLKGNILEATCSRAARASLDPTLTKLDLAKCPIKGDIWNKDGQLLCK